MSLHCKLIAVQSWEYEHGLLSVHKERRQSSEPIQLEANMCSWRYAVEQSAQLFLV